MSIARLRIVLVLVLVLLFRKTNTKTARPRLILLITKNYVKKIIVIPEYQNGHFLNYKIIYTTKEQILKGNSSRFHEKLNGSSEIMMTISLLRTKSVSKRFQRFKHFKA